MRRILLAFSLSLAAPLAFAAQPTEKQIDELLALTHAQALLESALEQVEGQQRAVVEQMLQGQPMSPEERARFDGMMSTMSRNLRDAMTWDKMRPVYQRVYTASFEAEDIDAMIAFYRTTAGQRVIDRMPNVMQNTMVEMQALMMPALQEFQEDLTAEIEASRGKAD